MKTTALDPRLKHMKVVDNKIRRELEDEMGQNILDQQVTGVDTEMKDSKEKKRKLQWCQIWSRVQVPFQKISSPLRCPIGPLLTCCFEKKNHA